MHVYEIRVLRSDPRHSTTAIVQTSYTSDFAAIRGAKALAGRDPVEVWREMDCVYSDVIRGTPS